LKSEGFIIKDVLCLPVSKGEGNSLSYYDPLGEPAVIVFKDLAYVINPFFAWNTGETGLISPSCFGFVAKFNRIFMI